MCDVSALPVSAPVRRCRWCLSEFAATNPRREFCDGDCRKRHYSRAQYAPADGYGAVLARPACIRCGDELDPAVMQGRNPVRLCESCKEPAPHECPCCGVVHRGSSPACSDACSVSLRRRRYRRKTDRRKAIIAVSSESFTAADVFDRDGYRCGICGEPVDPSIEWPDLRSASVDHIVPFARGGEHTFSNVQCSHLICNITKSAT